jgi:hypothetical protein
MSLDDYSSDEEYDVDEEQEHGDEEEERAGAESNVPPPAPEPEHKELQLPWQAAEPDAPTYTAQSGGLNKVPLACPMPQLRGVSA